MALTRTKTSLVIGGRSEHLENFFPSNFTEALHLMTNLETSRKQDADCLRRNAVKTGKASNWRCKHQVPRKIWRLCTPSYQKYTRSTFVQKVSICPRDGSSTLPPRRWYV